MRFLLDEELEVLLRECTPRVLARRSVAMVGSI
jgi:hypothetical protein